MPVLTAVVLDAIAVVAFAIAGRASHDEGLSVSGIADTAWPFLAALVIGWLIALAARLDLRGLPAGAVVWIATLAGGMLIRRLADDGTAFAFIVVATVVLGVLLMGWRVVRARLRHRNN